MPPLHLRRFWGRKAANDLRVEGLLAIAWALALLLVSGFRPKTLDAAAPASPQNEVIPLANRHLQLGLRAKDGAIVQFLDVAASHNHAGQGLPSVGLWSFKALCEGKTLAVTPAQAGALRWEKLPGETAALRLVWDGFQMPAAPELSVEVAVRLDAGRPMSSWEFAACKPAGLVLEEVRFPIVAGITPQENERLAVPAWMGEQVADPRRLLAGPDGKGRRLEWHYPGGLSMQCLAWYRNHGPGFYAATDDTACSRKTFALWGDNKAQVHFEVVHYPENDGRPRDRQSLGYRVLLGGFRGDWITAAERYRDWAAQQPWAGESRLRKGLTADWVLQTGAWVWNRGRSPQVLAPAAALQRKLGLPTSVFWHWWHGCAYDAGFPEYLPPREGAEAFRAAVADAHRESVRAIVYMNQRLWGMTTKSWLEENAASFAVKGPDGKIGPEVYNTFTRQPCASMCMGTPFWRNKYAGLAQQALLDLNVDGIYMDQACSSLPCYDARHGHSLGGGRYWMEGFRTLANDIRRRCDARPTIVLAGEGCGEAWLPLLDLMLTLQVSKERYSGPKDGWEVIPFFHAVYHPYAVLYGNYSSLTLPPYDDLWPAQFAPQQPLALLDRKYRRQFYLEQARAFVWGQQPTIANFLPSHLQERPEETDYFLRLARTRNRGTKYLLRGTFLRPPSLDVPSILVDFSRLSIYAGQQAGVKSFQKTSPSVLAGAWRAADGDLGIALASIVDQTLSVAIPLDAGYYSLPRQGHVYRIDDTGRSPVGRFDRTSPSVTVCLPPRAACIMEFTEN